MHVLLDTLYLEQGRGLSLGRNGLASKVVQGSTRTSKDSLAALCYGHAHGIMDRRFDAKSSALIPVCDFSRNSSKILASWAVRSSNSLHFLGKFASCLLIYMEGGFPALACTCIWHLLEIQVLRHPMITPRVMCLSCQRSQS